MTGRKLDRPLYIEMDFDEALTRFVKTDPKEVEDSIRRAKEAAGDSAPTAPVKSRKAKRD